MESGKSDVPASKLSEMAAALGVSVLDLVNGNGDVKICKLMDKCYGCDAPEAVKLFMQLSEEDQKDVMEFMKFKLQRKLR